MKDVLRIVHIEDLPTDVELVEHILKKGNLKFEKLVVDNKTDFIKALNTFRPDLILSDHSLPSFSSWEALQIVQSREQKVPFILITATISEEFAVEVMKMGAEDYILKDRMERLPGAIRNVMDKHTLALEKQRFLEAVVANEALLRDAEKMARMGSWQANLIDGTTHWSDEAYRIYGYAPGEVPASEGLFLRYVHPDDRQEVEASLKNALDHLDFERKEFRIINRRGEELYLLSEFEVVRNSVGKPILLKGFNQDISEMKRAESRLRQSEANLRTILENAHTGYILLDDQFNIITFNNLAKEWSSQGLLRGLEPGISCLACFKPERVPIVSELFRKALQGEHARYEVAYKLSDGQEHWFDTSIQGTLNGEGKIIGLVMSFLDISERKAMELQREKMTNDLIQRNQDLEQFTYIVSHNLRAPVANLIGFSEVLKGEALDEGMLLACVDGIHAASKKLDEVVHDLNFILQVKGEVHEQKVNVSFTRLVEDIQLSIRDSLLREGITITYDFNAVDELLTVKSYLYSIFYNLITNAIKYRQPDVPLTLHILSRRRGAGVELLFQDNGMGIDLEKHGSQVFGLYKRFHAHMEGKGMGLYMTKIQVEALGGTISIESKINQGTTFHIVL